MNKPAILQRHVVWRHISKFNSSYITCHTHMYFVCVYRSSYIYLKSLEHIKHYGMVLLWTLQNCLASTWRQRHAIKAQWTISVFRPYNARTVLHAVMLHIVRLWAEWLPGRMTYSQHLHLSVYYNLFLYCQDINLLAKIIYHLSLWLLGVRHKSYLARSGIVGSNSTWYKYICFAFILCFYCPA